MRNNFLVIGRVLVLGIGLGRGQSSDPHGRRGWLLAASDDALGLLISHDRSYISLHEDF